MGIHVLVITISLIAVLGITILGIAVLGIAVLGIPHITVLFVSAGVMLGYNYIRGCIDKIFVDGVLNRTALETHRFHFDDVCRLLPWHQLMSSSGRASGSGNGQPAAAAASQYRSGDVVLCSCYGNRCNGAPSNDHRLGRFGPVHPILLTVLLAFLAVVFTYQI